MPAFLTSRSLSPSRSRSPVPSLAPSWWCPWQTLRLVLIPTSYYAQSGLSACICFGPGLCLQVAIAFSCPLGALYLRTRCRSFWGGSSLLLGQLDLRLDPSGLTKSAACPPLSRSTVTGRLPLSLSQPLGPPVRCFLHFIFATFNTNLMAYFLLVPSWLRVLG